MEMKEHSSTTTSHMENVSSSNMAAERKEYILKRHGTLDLNPLPSDDPSDPLNWRSSKKIINLMLVSFHSMMTTFVSAGINPAYQEISKSFSVSIQTASYLTSVNILFLGLVPLVIKPLSSRYGRRPVFLLSTLLSCIANIGCAVSNSYTAMMVCRVLVAAFICPPLSIGPGVVTEMFFAHERGRTMGIWALFTTLGPPSGPFFMGFVTYHTHWRWVYWVFAIINAFQFVLYVFFGPETRYVGRESTISSVKAEYLKFRRIDPRPLTWREFYEPLLLSRFSTVLLPAVSFAIVFGFASVVFAVEIPLLFGERFHFNAQQLGLQYLSLIIGSILGEQAAGPLSDFLMGSYTRRLGRQPTPETRLWIAYIGYGTALVGFIVFCIQLQNAGADWNVTPLVGLAIAAFGNQVVTTVTITYSIDCHHEDSSSIGVFYGIFRATWGFISPFYAPAMFSTLGLGGSAGLMCGLVVAFGILPTLFLHVRGGHSTLSGC